ncbi:unnamed protein product, partial [Ectocarpus sp. 8 AP-2014]
AGQVRLVPDQHDHLTAIRIRQVSQQQPTPVPEYARSVPSRPVASIHSSSEPSRFPCVGWLSSPFISIRPITRHFAGGSINSTARFGSHCADPSIIRRGPSARKTHGTGPIGPINRSKGSFVGFIHRVVHHPPPGAHHPTTAVADEHVSRFNDWADQSNSPPVRCQGVSTPNRPFFQEIFSSRREEHGGRFGAATEPRAPVTTKKYPAPSPAIASRKGPEQHQHQR